MKLLHIDASILGPNSVSRPVGAAVVKRFADAHPDLEMTHTDLGAEPIGHLTGAHLAAGQGAVPDSLSLREDLARGSKALENFLSADIIVIGAPMYNFSISSQLKAWIDRVMVAGKTFRYTDNGPEGLAGNKKVVVVSSRGGFYGPGSAAAFLDHQESYLRGIFGFLGITDLTFVRAEGLNTGAEQRQQAIAAATTEAAQLAA